MLRWFRRPFGLEIVWLVLPFALVAFGFGVQPLKSWDYWWHIAMGRLVDATGQMPTENLFLYTLPPDRPGYVQPWIAQWALYRWQDAFGLHGVLILRNLLAAFAFGGIGLWASARARSPAVGAVLALVFSSFGFLTIAARSHLLAWPLFLVIVPLAYGLRSERLRKRAWLAVFPVVAALWANLHGTFVVPAVVCFAFAAADFLDQRLGRARSGPPWLAWGSTGVICLATSLLNPRGWEVYGYLWMLSVNAELRTTVTEWWPTTPLFPPFFGGLFYVSLVAVLVLMWRRRGELDFADLFMVAWIALLTIPQTRFMLWFSLTAPVAVAPYLRRGGRPDEVEPSAALQGAHLLVAGGLVVVALAVQPWGGSNQLAAELQVAPARTEQPLLGLVHADAPVEPVRLLGREQPPPRLFHDHRYSGFLMFWLDDTEPDPMVFVDNRIEMPTPQIWREFDRIGAGEEGAEALERWVISHVVTGYETQPGLVAVLKGSTDWSCPFDNGLYVLCVRN